MIKLKVPTNKIYNHSEVRNIIESIAGKVKIVHYKDIYEIDLKDDIVLKTTLKNAIANVLKEDNAELIS